MCLESSYRLVRAFVFFNEVKGKRILIVLRVLFNCPSSSTILISFNAYSLTLLFRIDLLSLLGFPISYEFFKGTSLYEGVEPKSVILWTYTSTVYTDLIDI